MVGQELNIIISVTKKTAVHSGSLFGKYLRVYLRQPYFFIQYSN